MGAKREEKYYRELKKTLNRYHKFSFKMPPKTKKLTPQQKAAITRVYNKLKGVIKAVDDSTRFQPMSFRPFKPRNRYPELAGLRTNRGIFTPAVGTIKTKRLKKIRYSIRKFGDYYFLDFKFPRALLLNPALIPEWVNVVVEQLKKSLPRGRRIDSIFYLRKYKQIVGPDSKYDEGLIQLYLTGTDLSGGETNLESTQIVGITIILS